MGLSFFNAERQRKKAIEDSISTVTSNEEPTSPSLRGVEVGEKEEKPKKEEKIVEKEYVKPKKKRTK